MYDIEHVRKSAKQALTIRTSTSEVDESLWDRANRLVRNVELISQLPEIAGKKVQIDQFSLYAATYFSDAGTARYMESYGTVPKMMGYEANNNGVLELCVEVIEEKLNMFLEEGAVKRITNIVSESSERTTMMLEAMVLSDARNFDDTGLMGIFNEYRRCVMTGKGVSGVLQGWKKKIDYLYWPARLKEGFRFESVRRLAEKRLIAAEGLMNQLEFEHSAEDLRVFLQE